MSAATPSRIVSIDQFRGYTVAGMFLVNFVGGMAAVSPLLKHNSRWFSYADSIMPSFIFLVGVSYRLTFLRRLAQQPARSVYLSYVRRSCALVLLSLMVFGFGNSFGAYSQITLQGTMQLVAKLFKADLWEVLAIIGVTQLLIMPVIAASSRVRLLTLIGCAAAHVLLSYSFNYDFVYGVANWMDPILGIPPGKTAWDGGGFGPISWAVAMLAGTLAYDILAACSPGQAALRMAGLGTLLMILGYGTSCIGSLYTVIPDDEAASAGAVTAEQASGAPEGVPRGRPRTKETAESPVLPPFAKLNSLRAEQLLAPPPFTPPRPPSVQQYSYWMMDKRMVSLPFILFSTGFAFAGTALFVVMCDMFGFQLGVFRTFGTNALAAYVIHEIIMHALKDHGLNLVPRESALWWCVVGTGIFFGITYVFVRHLEKHKLFLRL